VGGESQKKNFNWTDKGKEESPKNNRRRKLARWWGTLDAGRWRIKKGPRTARRDEGETKKETIISSSKKDIGGKKKQSEEGVKRMRPDTPAGQRQETKKGDTSAYRQNYAD